MPRIYLGFDPGMQGAIAAITADGSARVVDMPTVVTKATRREILAGELAALVALFAENGDGGVTAVFEKPIAMPRQASQSTLAAGRGVGLIEGVLAALRVPYESIAPSAWKAQMGIPKGATKDVSRARALALFPALAEQLARKKDDGRAEALLLAEWRRRQDATAAVMDSWRRRQEAAR
jgi:crossover junction endodeoxyribonuclease RuvC